MPCIEHTYFTPPANPVAPLVRNPFKRDVLKRQFDAMVAAFDNRHSDLVRVDRRDGRFFQHRGNAWATHFWWGFNGARRRIHYAGSYNTPAYACFRAGKAASAALLKAKGGA